MNNKLKNLDVLKDSLMPFMLIIDDNGIILSSGKSLNKMIGKNIESMNINDVIEFLIPNNFKDLKKLKDNSLIKYKIKNTGTSIKASSKYYSQEKALFVNGIPIINANHSLSSTNLNLNDFSETTVMAEYLFLVESNKRGMAEAYRLIEDMKSKNKSLNSAFTEIENISRFPSENPNPVMRLSTDGTLLFANESAIENFMEPYGLNIGDQIDENYNFLLNFASSASAPIERVLKMNNKTFSVSYCKVTDREYMNVYAVDITNPINEIAKREQELEIAKNTLVQLNENLETKVAEGIEINKKLQSEIFQQDKLVTLGELSAGVAHDLNTPLGAVQASSENIRSILEKFFKDDLLTIDKNHVLYACELATREELNIFLTSREERVKSKEIQKYLEEKHPNKFNNYVVSKILTNASISVNDEEILNKILNEDNPNELLNAINTISQIRKSIDTILSAVDKSANVIKTLKDYVYKEDSEEFGNINFLESINNILKLFNNELKKGVDVIKEIDPNFEIKGSLMRLNQVWTNLLKNAIQAMNNKGSIIIEAESTKEHKIVHFKNNGPKIKDENLNKIFEPFYTTKKRKEGTGMGLSIVTRIIKDHRASIEVKSTEKETCFTIKFRI